MASFLLFFIVYLLLMNTILALILTFIAGISNGSFALPTKNIKQWHFENIWINFSFWAFLILPWLIIFLLAPTVGSVYKSIPYGQLWILILGGVGFGIGQVCFAQALTLIGFGLGFVINIGLGTGLGFLMPLVFLHPEKILTPFGYVTLIGSGFIFAGLVLSYLAGHRRDAYRKQIQPTMPPSKYSLGVLLSIIAGIFSSGQNFSFAATIPLQHLALNNGINHLASAMIIWPIFLSFSFIPYAIYMLYLHGKNNSYVHYRGDRTIPNLFLSIIMAILWFIPLVLYSLASLLIGNLGPIVAWPLFMVLIILTSNFWGWRHHEWANTTPEITRQALQAIGLLVIAVIILGFAATLS